MSLARRKFLQLVGLLGAPTVFLLVFFFGPLLIMLVYSFLTPGLIRLAIVMFCNYRPFLWQVRTG